VNNAGWRRANAAYQNSREDQDRMIAVNLRAPIALTRMAAMKMSAQGSGAIVNIASSAARKMPPASNICGDQGGSGRVHARVIAELARVGQTRLITLGLVDTR